MEDNNDLFFLSLVCLSFLLSSFLWTTLCLSAFSTASIFRLWLPSHSHPLSLFPSVSASTSPLISNLLLTTFSAFSFFQLLRLPKLSFWFFFALCSFFFHFLSVNGSYCIFITLFYSCFLLPPSAFTQCWFFSSCSPPLSFHSIFHILLFFLPSHFVSLSLSSRHFHSSFLCSGTFAKCSLSLQFLSFLSFQHLSAFFALSFGVSLPFHIFISDVFITCTVYRWIVYWKNYKCTLELMTATILWATNSLVYDITTWTFLLGVGDKTKRKQHI